VLPITVPSALNKSAAVAENAVHDTPSTYAKCLIFILGNSLVMIFTKFFLVPPKHRLAVDENAAVLGVSFYQRGNHSLRKATFLYES
jgi:hypothetical protein